MIHYHILPSFYLYCYADPGRTNAEIAASDTTCSLVLSAPAAVPDAACSQAAAEANAAESSCTSAFMPETAARQGNAVVPSPPHIPAIRPVAPRPSSAFRHSMSAMPDKAPLPNLHPRSSHQLSGDDMFMQQTSNGIAGDGSFWGRHDEGTVQRPFTADQAKIPSALQEEHFGVQRHRPQTAFTAGHARPVRRYSKPLNLATTARSYRHLSQQRVSCHWAHHSKIQSINQYIECPGGQLGPNRQEVQFSEFMQIRFASYMQSIP